MKNSLAWVGALGAWLVFAGGCAQQSRSIGQTGPRGFFQQSTPEVTTATAASASASVSEAGAEVVTEGDTLRYVLPYPTGDRATSVLLVEKIVPAKVREGETYQYTIRVTNLTDAPVSDVVVNDTTDGVEVEVAASARDAAAAPPVAGGLWEVGTLAPGATESLVLESVAEAAGELGSCLAVDFEPSLCTAMQVTQSSLKVSKAGPSEAYVCESLVYKYSVTNIGTTVAQNVMVSEVLPEGLLNGEGTREVLLSVGDLPAGQTREFAVTVTASAAGRYESRATAQSSDEKVLSQAVATHIVQPTVAVSLSGPEWQYPNQPVTYTVEVSNPSDVPARDTVVRLEPENVASQAQDREVGTLGPRESKRFNVTFEAEEAPIRLAAAARATCAAVATARVETAIRAMAALDVETVDDRDPVRVGDNTVYTVTVRNRGQAEARNVKLSAVLPPNMSFVEADGPTDVRAVEGRLDIAAVAALSPGQSATWDIKLRAEQPGAVRFRTDLQSELLRTPVMDEEPTSVLAVDPAASDGAPPAPAAAPAMVAPAVAAPALTPAPVAVDPAAVAAEPTPTTLQPAPAAVPAAPAAAVVAPAEPAPAVVAPAPTLIAPVPAVEGAAPAPAPEPAQVIVDPAATANPAVLGPTEGEPAPALATPEVVAPAPAVQPIAPAVVAPAVAPVQPAPEEPAPAPEAAAPVVEPTAPVSTVTEPAAQPHAVPALAPQPEASPLEPYPEVPIAEPASPLDPYPETAVEDEGVAPEAVPVAPSAPIELVPDEPAPLAAPEAPPAVPAEAPIEGSLQGENSP